MLKPHLILLLSAVLALCAAVFLTAADHEPKAALAAGYTLIAGVTSLALYLSDRQKSRMVETESGSAQTECKTQDTVNVASNTAVNAPNEPKINRYEPRYTSHSRA